MQYCTLCKYACQLSNYGAFFLTGTVPDCHMPLVPTQDKTLHAQHCYWQTHWQSTGVTWSTSTKSTVWLQRGTWRHIRWGPVPHGRRIRRPILKMDQEIFNMSLETKRLLYNPGHAPEVTALTAETRGVKLIHQTHVRKIYEVPSLRALKAMYQEPSGPFITSLLELKLDTNTTLE